MEKCDQQRLESLEEKKAAHIAKDDRPANARDVNPLETIWIIVDVTKYKDRAPKTLDELRLRFAWKITLFGSSYILYLIT